MPTVKQARDELGRLLAAIYFIVDSLILLKMLYFIMELKDSLKGLELINHRS